VVFCVFPPTGKKRVLARLCVNPFLQAFAAQCRRSASPPGARITLAALSPVRVPALFPFPARQVRLLSSVALGSPLVRCPHHSPALSLVRLPALFAFVV
jgi:hypothetical protein